MKYRNYKVRTFEHGLQGEALSMIQFLAHINKHQEKIVEVIPIGNVGAFVNIITLGQDDN